MVNSEKRCSYLEAEIKLILSKQINYLEWLNEEPKTMGDDNKLPNWCKHHNNFQIEGLKKDLDVYQEDKD